MHKDFFEHIHTRPKTHSHMLRGSRKFMQRQQLYMHTHTHAHTHMHTHSWPVARVFKQAWYWNPAVGRTVGFAEVHSRLLIKVSLLWKLCLWPRAIHTRGVYVCVWKIFVYGQRSAEVNVRKCVGADVCVCVFGCISALTCTDSLWRDNSAAVLHVLFFSAAVLLAANRILFLCRSLLPFSQNWACTPFLHPRCIKIKLVKINKYNQSQTFRAPEA